MSTHGGIIAIIFQGKGAMPIVRNSFIQMSKLTNLKGRINYISSHARQENLYAVYETTDRKFWTELAKCNQEEFKKSGTVVGRISLVRLHLGNAKKALISGLAPPPDGGKIRLVFSGHSLVKVQLLCVFE